MVRRLLGTLIAASACSIGFSAMAADITVLSSDPARVTGGDALIELQRPFTKVTLNDQDVSAAFGPADAAGHRVGLVKGLRDGSNTLQADDGSHRAKLSLYNYPISGPVFSGPHQKPFICETGAFRLPDGKNLGPSQEPDCWAPTNVQYLYKSAADGKYKPLGAGGPPEAVAKTTTTTGAGTDIIVRLESGVINRAIYQIAVLAKPGAAVSPAAPLKTWNGRLIYAFGGGCGVAFKQGTSTGGVIDNLELGNEALEKGYALASATLNVLGSNCNDVTSAETAMMVKEHFAKTFGPPKHTLGWGGSGGSMQQNLIAANYPGILDGLLPGRGFPDMLTTLVSLDCPLLNNYFGKTKTAWTDAQRTAVSGYSTYGVCAMSWPNYVPRWVLASDGCVTASLTMEGGRPRVTMNKETRFKLYDPATAPDGVRCTIFDNGANVWGRRPDGAANRPVDNIGVQYGLKAFNEGTISFEQFVELNQQIGGYDTVGHFVSARTQADAKALDIAYATGRLNQHYGMDSVPIIDIRVYTDAGPDVHNAYFTAVARARRARAGDNPQDFVTWEAQSTGNPMGDFTSPTTPFREMTRQSVYALDGWLDAIDADTSNLPRAQKIAKNRPASLHDACFVTGSEGVKRVDEPNGVESGGCFTQFPNHADPRIVAGEPLTRLYIKCALRPVSAALYGRRVTDEQVAQLKQVFPGGVCDYTKPPVGMRKPAGAWLNYPSPGVYQKNGSTY